MIVNENCFWIAEVYFEILGTIYTQKLVSFSYFKWNMDR